MTFPVHYSVVKPERYSRLQLATRLLAFVVLGILGLTLGSLFAVAYVALPVFAAARLGAGRTPALFLLDDGARVERALGWLAAVYAWFGLVTDALPRSAPAETVRLEIERDGRPTAASALVRVIYGLPSALALAVLGCLAGFVWLWSALTILVRGRVGDGAFWFLSGIQRWTVRLLAYQASLVDEYPPFTFEDTSPAWHAPQA
jgi:hypothetical protein